MDVKVRALKLETMIREAVPGLTCDVRISTAHPLRGLAPLVFVTVTIARETAFLYAATCEDRHRVHELVALEFHGEQASIQLFC